MLESFFAAQSVDWNGIHHDHGGYFRPHPCPSASGMLRDPEQVGLFLVETIAEEGVRPIP
jgi:hypothetical protein